MESFSTDVELEMSTRQWNEPIIIAGGFNSKSRTLIGGPENQRGQLLDEAMGTHQLIVTNEV